ncbi:unnamed protein product, partial [Choristocarpus tenellus]
GQKYCVLCIITDGRIHDINETRDAIVEASSLPLSIVVVGVGNHDFTPMRDLDSDNEKLMSLSGKVAVRDVVQFVPFNDFQGRDSTSQHALAKHVLQEIPSQFLSFMKSKNILPSPRRRLSPLTGAG